MKTRKAPAVDSLYLWHIHTYKSIYILVHTYVHNVNDYDNDEVSEWTAGTLYFLFSAATQFYFFVSSNLSNHWRDDSETLNPLLDDLQSFEASSM